MHKIWSIKLSHYKIINSKLIPNTCERHHHIVNHKNTHFIHIIFENLIFIFQDREFVEVDLPLVGALKKVGGPVASSAPSPTPSDTANQSIFNNCCGKSNCCRKVICMICFNYCQVNQIHEFVSKIWKYKFLSFYKSTFLHDTM